MLNWGDERYVRVYAKDTPGWLMLPWQGRALQLMLERKLDRAGLLDFAEYAASEATLYEAMAVLVQLPVEVVAAGLPALLARGTFEMNGGVLVMPNFLEAQEAKISDAARARAWREKKRDVARSKARGVLLPSQGVTLPYAGERSRSDTFEHSREANGSSQGVTVANGSVHAEVSAPSEDVPDDLGGDEEVETTVTGRDAPSQGVTEANAGIRNRSHPPSVRHAPSLRTVPSRTVPSRAVPPNGGAPSAPAASRPGKDQETQPKPERQLSHDARSIASEIARHRVFESLDAKEIGEAQAGFMMTAPLKLSWVLEAVQECAAKTAGLGLAAPALQSKLIGFMRHARAPRPGEDGPIKPPEEIDLSHYKNRNTGRTK